VTGVGTVGLRDLATKRGLIGGPFGSSLVGTDYTPSGVPVIRGTNLGHGRFLGGDFAYVSPTKANGDLARNQACPGDLVFTQRGTLGQVALVPEGGADAYVVSQSQMRLRVEPGRADARFVYYACTTPDFMRQIGDHTIATGVPHINLGILGALRVPDFPRSEQRAIAEVLGALDDKIAANTRLATTADGLVTTLFAGAVAGAAWGPSTFADVADIGGGGTPSSKVAEYWDGQVPWASPTDITRLTGPYLFDTGRKITESGLANCSSRLYPTGSILMTSRATIGAFALAQTPVAVNQGFIVVVPPDDTLRYWLLHEMRDRVDELLTHANGATFLELSRGNFRRLPVRFADSSVMAAFGQRANALHAAGAAALRESLTLAATRDALLPALMSGTLRVRDAERLVGEAV
jgi:type I restriction enzyme S subunit